MSQTSVSTARPANNAIAQRVALPIDFNLDTTMIIAVGSYQDAFELGGHLRRRLDG
ncbi:MAG: hypothetical protein R3C68_17015 [Myxococcota bacterium]